MRRLLGQSDRPSLRHNFLWRMQSKSPIDCLLFPALPPLLSASRKKTWLYIMSIIVGLLQKSDQQSPRLSLRQWRWQLQNVEKGPKSLPVLPTQEMPPGRHESKRFDHFEIMKQSHASFTSDYMYTYIYSSRDFTSQPQLYSFTVSTQITPLIIYFYFSDSPESLTLARPKRLMWILGDKIDHSSLPRDHRISWPPLYGP